MYKVQLQPIQSQLSQGLHRFKYGSTRMYFFNWIIIAKFWGTMNIKGIEEAEVPRDNPSLKPMQCGHWT